MGNVSKRCEANFARSARDNFIACGSTSVSVGMDKVYTPPRRGQRLSMAPDAKPPNLRATAKTLVRGLKL